MIRYFKPRRDLEYSRCLVPQKVEKDKAYRYEEGRWRENFGKPDYSTLKKNFIEVDTNEEAIN